MMSGNQDLNKAYDDAQDWSEVEPIFFLILIQNEPFLDIIRSFVRVNWYTGHSYVKPVLYSQMQKTFILYIFTSGMAR